MKSEEILKYAQELVQLQAQEVLRLGKNLDESFVNCINACKNCKGKLVLVGVGKNKPIAEKMVATLNSTGTRAQFLHAGEALHGDLGLLAPEDIAIVLSKSGNTAEIKNALPSIKKLSKQVIAITGNMHSYLAKNADIVLDTTVSRELGYLDVAPTTSTTVQLVICDIIAVILKQLKNFTKEDFGVFHPGGSLGKKLSWKVADMVDSSQKPRVDIDADIKEVIQSLTSGRFGITVVEQKGKIVGVITDGDLRRMLQKYSDLNGIKANDIATFAPKTIHKDVLAVDALKIINQNKIGQLIVVDDNNDYFGIIDFHVLTNEGLSEAQ
ncbi:KpsF/GutQ family sugar-phosphate isomerase [Ornithobacterium rhinotracheale]|uniref:KpsF/GutQ family sugar-phosphate isomerase n=1 Tax=Ornithobacterium rhinotracheale TaxID=28251 RepID=UPI00403645E4